MTEEALALRATLDAEQVLLGNDWLARQEPRKQEEAEFHDADRADHADEQGLSRQENRRFYGAYAEVDATIDRWIAARAAGRIFLDYACGHGNQALIAAERGAALSVGIDISAVSVSNATERAKARGVADRVRFLQRDCEATGFADATFDAVLCSGVLHHMDLTRVYPELARITKPGGRILAVEALGHNPVIQLYRDRTPHLRTAWEREHILRTSDAKLAARWFDVASVRYFNLVSPLAMLFPRGVIRDAAHGVAKAADALLTRLPGIRLLSWVFVFELVKPATPRGR